MRRALERYARRLWYGSAEPGPAWRLAAGLHRAALGRRWQRPAERPSRPVVLVGNLTVGGSGKTPVVMALARLLTARGLRVAIISRGYGGRRTSRPRRVNSADDPRQVGDEPAMMAGSSEVPVWIGVDRRRVFEAAVAAGAEVVLSDDGLQHRALPRSFEIVVIDGERGLGNGFLLPAGPLRSPPERMAQADAVVVRGPCDGPSLPGQVFELEASALVELNGSDRRGPDGLAGRQVSAVCGIGNPDQFAAQLGRLGMRVELFAFPDHHVYRAGDLDGIPGPVVTTAKDAVKLRTLGSLPERVWVLEVQARLPQPLVDSVLTHVGQFRP
ncbi:MAG: tetraacyldisaccharide 4'-kinase [Wenzhouxiangella sp.]|nr:MAG: tetraacyldisaccharide 4'-kinase [Wenzhouxiangella sp.]